MTTDDLLLYGHYLSVVLAIVIPLYYWYVKKERDSKVFKIARAVRIANAIFYLYGITFLLEVFWDELPLGLEMVALFALFAYLLARRWAPKKRPNLAEKGLAHEQVS